MFKLTNAQYDFLKWIAQYLLPALATLYATIGKIWGLPYTIEISATLMALDTFLGVCLGISSYTYQGDEYD
jgi:ABC-type dipeptide/oligopeptide/nickel transport system permease component